MVAPAPPKTQSSSARVTRTTRVRPVWLTITAIAVNHLASPAILNRVTAEPQRKPIWPGSTVGSTGQTQHLEPARRARIAMQLFSASRATQHLTSACQLLRRQLLPIPTCCSIGAQAPSSTTSRVAAQARRVPSLTPRLRPRRTQTAFKH